jgi:cell division protein YceG involved in septum cleavage
MKQHGHVKRLTIIILVVALIVAQLLSSQTRRLAVSLFQAAETRKNTIGISSGILVRAVRMSVTLCLS